MSKISISSTKMVKLRKYRPRMEAFKDRIEQAFNTLSELYITQNATINTNNIPEKITNNNLNKKIDFKDSSLNKNIKIKKYKLLDQGTSTQEKNENESNSNEKKEDIENKRAKEDKKDNKDNKIDNEEDGNTKVYSDKVDSSENSSSLNENNSKENKENKEKKENEENEQKEGNENIKDKDKDKNKDKEEDKASSKETNNIQDDKTNITNDEENDNNSNNNNNNSKKDIAKANESEKNINTIDKKDKSEVKQNSIKNIKKNSKIIKNNYKELKDNEKEIILPFVHKIKNLINKLNEIKNNSNISEDDINGEISLLPDRSLIELSLVKFKLTKKYEFIKELYDKQSKELSKLIEENISQRNLIEEYKKAELENNNKINNLNNEIKILKTKLYNSYQEIQNYQQQLKKSNNMKSPKISLDQTIKNILNKKDNPLNDTLKKKINKMNYSLNPNLENILNNKEKSLKRTNSDFVKLKEDNKIEKIENGISDYRNKKAIYSPLNKININMNMNNNELQSTSKDYFSSINTSRQRNKYSRFNNSSLDYDTLNIASGYKRFEIKNSVNLNNLNSLFINSSRKLTPLKIKNANIVCNNGENN